MQMICRGGKGKAAEGDSDARGIRSIEKHVTDNDRGGEVRTWTATSVFPVPGGPTTRVRPGDRPDRTASTCTGVNLTKFPAMSVEKG